MHALLDDPDTGALAFVVDLVSQEDPEGGYVGVAKEVAAVSAKPVAVMSNMRSAIDRELAASLRGSGIPVLEGTATGLAAIGHLFEHRDYRGRPPLRRPAGPPLEVRDRWTSRLAREEPLDEVEALALLGDYGIPVVTAERASSERDARRAAERIGWPVALKTAGPGVVHKADVEGVKLGIADAAALRDAYEDLRSRLGPQVTVAAMAPPGIEMALGIVRDAQFGPLVLVAAGGVLIEVLRDRALAVPPLDETRARRLVDRLSVRPLLAGVRGAPAADVQSLARAATGLSVLAVELGEHLRALDVNPLLVGPAGCTAVDALVISEPSG